MPPVPRQFAQSLNCTLAVCGRPLDLARLAKLVTEIFMNRIALHTLQRTFFHFGIVLMVLLLMYYGQIVLVPVALAVMLAFILFPLVAWLERRGLRRTLGAILALLLATVVLGAMLLVLYLQANHLLTRLPFYKEDIKKNLAPIYNLGKRLSQIEELSHPSNEKDKTEKGAAGDDAAGDAAPPARTAPAPDAAHTDYLALFPSGVRLGADLFLVTVLTLFFLLKPEDLRDRLIQLMGRRSLTKTTKALDDASTRISRYLLLQIFTNAIFGVCVWVGLFLIGVPYSFLWAFPTVFLRFIPYVGVWLAAVPPLVLSLAHAPEQALLVLILWIVVESSIAGIVEPLLFSHDTGVSAPGLLVAAVLWAFLWGPAGLLLAIPLTVCLVVLGEYFPALSFLAVLLGEQPSVNMSAQYYHRLLARDREAAASFLEKYLQTDSSLSVYDEVVLPSLIQAKVDLEEGSSSAEDHRFILRATRDLVNRSFFDYAQPAGTRDTLADGRRHRPDHSYLRVLGCPVLDREDLLALEMLRQILGGVDCELVIVARRRLLQEIRKAQRDHIPYVVCLGALPPGGDAPIFSLCRRLHKKAPGAKILVGRWGERGKERAHKLLHSFGVLDVADTLAETRAHIDTLARDARLQEAEAATLPE